LHERIELLGDDRLARVLALTRVKQVNVEGWADRFREAQAKREQKPNGDR
jgi:hypothetical protein